ncbi:ras GTPase-activating-like protein [Scheffersomyces coipomensis]|uniref:ras GTPase-activating-like protein n=1 Tax=Scheffersomyces coipomensis TaxID=1788519 RepID=UPI00315CB6E1
MSSPTRGNITSRYLDNLNENIQTPTRLPLQPTLKYNSNNDLERLAKELNITPSTGFLKSKFESPSATVNSFKTASSNKSSSNNSKNNTPSNKANNNDEEEPSWAKKGYRDVLKMPKSSPFLSSPSNSTSKDSPGYEYLCRIQAIKDWLELMLKEDIDQKPAEMISYVRNGIYLAKLTNVILSEKKSVFMNDSRLQFKHTENINRFFHLEDYLNVPDLFRFELTDLYDAKNIPKVFFCLHALSYILYKSDPNFPVIKNLVNKIDFEGDDIRTANRSLVGSGLPNFEGADASENVNQNSYMNKLITKSPIKAKNTTVISNSTKSDPFRADSTDASKGKTTFQSRLERKQESKPTSSSSTYKQHSLYTPEIEKYTNHVIKLQSLSRGANFRYRMFVDKIILKSYSDEFTQLNSKIRGNMSRMKSIHVHRDEIMIYKNDIIELQSIARKKLRNQQIPQLISSDKYIIQLQSRIRSKRIQTSISTRREGLAKELDTIINFQTLAKMKLIHYKSKTVLEHKDYIEDSVISFQAACRRYLYTRLSSVDATDPNKIIEFQSIIRKNKVINKVDKMRASLTLHAANIKELQTIARGAISRTRVCNTVLVSLLEDQSFDKLFAKVRGNTVRSEMFRKKAELNLVLDKSIIPAQSRIRGVLCRFEKEIKLDDLYYQINEIISLQSIVRGTFIRSDSKSSYRYYNENIAKVIKAQSVIRQALTRKAYKSLISKKNPPLSAIRRFAYLLSDNDGDFEEEMKISDLRESIIEKAKGNEELENQIENLDIKLSLLDKNKITLEDFIKNKKRYGSISRPSKNTTSSTSKSMDKLNKSSRERVDLYQTLFYFLQTKPAYLVRLYNAYTSSESDTEHRKKLEKLICSIFPITNSSVSHHSREEFYFVKLIFSFMENDMVNHSKTVSDITKIQTSFWIDFFLHFNSHTYQRQHLKLIGGKFVCKIIENDQLDFESDPSRIYEAIIEREIKIYGTSDNPRDITPQAAIKKDVVSKQFVSNLVGLRESTAELLSILRNSSDRVPLHVKLVCHKAYKLSQLNFPEKTDQQHLSVAGVIFMKHYVASILQYPENFGIFVPEKEGNARANLKHLSRVMLQVFSMKPFSDNFLKPLNEYLQTTVEATRLLMKSLIQVKDIESEYEFTDYDDIINPERPKLSVTVSNTLQLENILHQNMDIVAPSPDDQLFQTLIKLQEVVGSSGEFLKLTEMGILTLSLNPVTIEESLSDSKARSLLTQAKRAVLYIVRVQDGDNFLEVLISGISKVDEVKFRDIVNQERKENEESKENVKKMPYYKTSLGDLTKLSYHNLKRQALELILKLEAMGELSRRNSYQDLLNMIAIDIRTKDSQRIFRKQQLELSTKTVAKLTTKETFLKNQLNEYNTHVESILSQLQSKPVDKKLFNIIPIFSKQYFYHRELRKNNRLPKFGSYKYSAKKLLDQKIILDFGGLIHRENASSSKLDFMFSCHQVGKFSIEAANGSVAIPGASETISLDDLLFFQYENKEKIHLFNNMVVLDTQNLTGFIFRKFYDIKKD